MKNKWRSLLLILLAFLLVACGKQRQLEHPDEAEENMTVVGFVQIGSESLWRSANTESIQSALSKEAGYFLVYKNARQKQENQIKAIREFISQRVDYIIFSPCEETGWENVLQEAKSAGIPVLLIDRKIETGDDSLYTTWIGSNMVEEGKKAAQWLEQHQMDYFQENEKIHIAVLTGTEGATATIDRMQGFREIQSQHPEWEMIEEVSGDFTTAKGYEVMKQLLKVHRQIDVVLSLNDDMTFGAISAIEEVGMTTGDEGDIKVISFDATRQGLEYVAEGKINVNIECNPNQGEEVKKVIQQIESGFYIFKNYYIEEEVFTKENVDEALPNRTY